MTDTCRFRWVCSFAILLITFSFGCDTNTSVKQAPAASPMPTFTGPTYLHGTVGSLAQVNGNWPLLVSRYGVVQLPKETGAVGVPQFLEQSMVQYMRKIGYQSAIRGTQKLSPERVLADPHTAIVKVEALVPAGATKGQRTDILVTSMLGTETTSLKDGRMLFPIELGVRGADRGVHFTEPMVVANGDLYGNPYGKQLTIDDTLPSSIIIAGGYVVTDRALELVLNRPSASIASDIANRINERFPKGPQDRWPTANPRSDTQIQINVPKRFAGRPGDLVRLINHMYIQRSPSFEIDKARQLADVLLADPSQADRITLAWQALNKRALTVIGEFYTHDDMPVRLAALRAGSRLRDERTNRYLLPLADNSDPKVRLAAAELLAYQQYSNDASMALLRLVNDDDLAVRIKAYQSLAAIRHHSVIDYRTIIRNDAGLKYILDLVPSEKPLIYISERDIPRIVIFGPMTGLKSDSNTIRLWDNRMMIRLPINEGQTMGVFYQQVDDYTGKVDKVTVEIMPALANLLVLLGREMTIESDGLSLSFGQVVNAIYLLQKEGYIDAPLEIQRSRLVEVIEKSRTMQQGDARPETAQ